MVFTTSRCFLLLFLMITLVLANKHKTKHERLKASRKELRDAKKALQSLTYTKSEQIYSIANYKEEREDSINDATDNCSLMKCDPGKTCYLEQNGTPYCDCVESCPEGDGDPYIKVCSTTNVTYSSQCELYRLKCVDPEAMQGESMDYFGPCKVMEQCKTQDLAVFPQRIRNWFMDVMRQLSERPQEDGGLDPEEQEVEELSEKDVKPWRRPLHWKFFNMDTNPQDFHLSDAELMPMRSQLLPMEPCTDAFIASCDTNDDDLISIVEWGRCMGLNDDEILYRY